MFLFSKTVYEKCSATTKQLNSVNSFWELQILDEKHFGLLTQSRRLLPGTTFKDY